MNVAAALGATHLHDVREVRRDIEPNDRPATDINHFFTD
jgi:hypothetical protein